jgi:WD40 repeat protein
VAVISNLDRNTGVDERSRCLLLWDVESGTRIHQVIAPHANALSVSSDGTRIAEAGADMKVRLRDAETLEVAQTLRVHQGPVTDVAWHPNLPILATCSEDFFVRIWDLTTMDLLQEYGTFASFPTRLSWSPDGTRLSVLLSTGELGLFTPPLSKPQ